MNVSVLAGFIDEMEKIGASRGTAGYMQSRRGTRPIRVHNLLGRDTMSSNSPCASSEATNPEDQQPETPQFDGGEGGGDESSIGKTAEILTKERKEKAIGAFASARPYAAGALKAALPAALAAKIIAGDGPKGSHAARVAGLIGAGVGTANEALKSWAEKNKRKAVAQQILGD